MIDLTSHQLDGLIYALEIAADDQENYFATVNPIIDYTSEDLRTKATSFRNIAESVQALSQPALRMRFEELADTADMLATSSEVAEAI
jgi:hypothetical protein